MSHGPRGDVAAIPAQLGTTQSVLESHCSIGSFWAKNGGGRRSPGSLSLTEHLGRAKGIGMRLARVTVSL